MLILIPHVIIILKVFYFFSRVFDVQVRFVKHQKAYLNPLLTRAYTEQIITIFSQIGQMCYIYMQKRYAKNTCINSLKCFLKITFVLGET